MQIKSNFISDVSLYRPSKPGARVQGAVRQKEVEKGIEESAAQRRDSAPKNNAANAPVVDAEKVVLSSSKTISAPYNASHINFYRSSENADLSKRKQDALATYRRNSTSPFSVDGKSEFIGIDLKV